MKKIAASVLLFCLLFCSLTSAANFAAAQETGAQTKEIFVTFDDGPTDSTTPKVLDVLQREKVPATFFVIGRQINGREKTLRRIAAEGHAIGIHSYSHQYKEIYQSADALLADIEKCRKAIQNVLPQYDRMLYRFPGGSFLCPHLRDAVVHAGYRYFDWNASAGDAEGNFSAKTLYENAVKTSEGKNPVVLLLHDGVGYRETIRALPDIVQHFKKDGYTFKTL